MIDHIKLCPKNWNTWFYKIRIIWLIFKAVTDWTLSELMIHDKSWSLMMRRMSPQTRSNGADIIQRGVVELFTPLLPAPHRNIPILQVPPSPCGGHTCSCGGSGWRWVHMCRGSRNSWGETNQHAFPRLGFRARWYSPAHMPKRLIPKGIVRPIRSSFCSLFEITNTV